jgi:glycosyltransferase involved in cell wall biosynthesis
MKLRDEGEPPSDKDKLRIVYAVTVPVCLSYLRGQLRYMRECGYEVTVISSPGEELDCAAREEGVQAIAISMAREIAPLQDFLSLWRLCRVMRRIQPAITNVGTPKAGLLGGLAAFLTGVPCRIYTLHGLRFETAEGMKQRILMQVERFACSLAHRVICVSESVRKKVDKLGIAQPAQLRVLGSGSCNGIDVESYSVDRLGCENVRELRGNLGIPEGTPVIGFVGRLTRSKGAAELFQAYRQVRKTMPDVRLVLVGRFEEGEPLSAEIRQALEADLQVVLTGFVPDPSLFYHLMDVVALPSYREGFPGAVLEANAAGKPVVAFRATGTTDAVMDGVNGILLPLGDVQGLARTLELLLRDKSLNAVMGAAGKERARKEFSQERIWDALAEQYSDLCSIAGCLRYRGKGIQPRIAAKSSCSPNHLRILRSTKTRYRIRAAFLRLFRWHSPCHKRAHLT